MKKNFIKAAAAAILASGTLIPATISQAQIAPAQPSAVTLVSDVKIERVAVDPAGKEQVTLHNPKDVVVTPGDRVIFTLTVNNTGKEAAAGFRAVNPMPGPVQFVSVREEWAEVSVDGGTDWGKLPALKVSAKAADTGAETVRAAVPDDVTHVRWVFAETIPAGGKRTISYRGVVK